jgi:WD40 repeat protein
MLLLPNGDLLSGSADSTIKMWNLESGMGFVECKKTFIDHKAAVYSLKLLSDDKVISCSCDRTIRIWDIKNLMCIMQLTGNFFSKLLCSF